MELLIHFCSSPGGAAAPHPGGAAAAAPRPGGAVNTLLLLTLVELLLLTLVELLLLLLPGFQQLLDTLLHRD